jgi:hypothetical protein
MSKLGLAETIKALKAKGYSEDFNLRENCLECQSKNFQMFADEFKIDSVFRFDEMSDPSDQAILYAIRSKKDGTKGTLVNSFGLYSEPVTNEIVAALLRAERGSGKSAS